MIRRITVRYGNILQYWPVDIDMEASCKRFAEKMAEALRAEYPEAEVEVTVDSRIDGGSLVSLDCDGGYPESSRCRQVIDQIKHRMLTEDKSWLVWKSDTN